MSSNRKLIAELIWDELCDRLSAHPVRDRHKVKRLTQVSKSVVVASVEKALKTCSLTSNLKSVE